MKRIMLSVLALCIGVLYASACTNLIVGKNASADGSVFVSYSADDFGCFGYLRHFPRAKHKKGEARSVYDWETGEYRGEIEEAEETYNVVGNMNEYQLCITETTFGGRSELVDTTGIIDYGSLIYIALQRAKTPCEAIKVMTSLLDKYGYASAGESFTIANKEEAWIMDVIGKGPGRKGAVWVAMRVPDDCISAHANHSRIRQFPLKDKDNCLYASDVISFAREKGYFKGKRDADFSFSEAYAPADFGALRFCEARVWSFFNMFSTGMEQYLPYAKGDDVHATPMPLFVKPDSLLSLSDVRRAMRDHYENTPFDILDDPGMGPTEAPYRPTPLVWEVDGKKYFNERPISTQQSSFVMIAQMRSTLPDHVGGILWFGCDDASMMAFTPMYSCMTSIPQCYNNKVANGLEFSFKSAFWVCNWVATIVYPRYAQLHPEVERVYNRLEADYDALQAETEQKAMACASQEEAVRLLTNYSLRVADGMMYEWMELGKRLMVKYIDGTVRPESAGRYEVRKSGLPVSVERPGYPLRYRRLIVEKTGERYLVK